MPAFKPRFASILQPKKTKKTRAVPTAQYSELGHFER